jgi:hypothetical protein
VTLLQTSTLAERTAQANFAANSLALQATQPRLLTWLNDAQPSLEYVFAKDRQLSALDETGAWIGGCSAPSQVADALLGRLHVSGSVGCLLAPSHAAVVSTSLRQLRIEQGIVAVVPELRDLSIILHCHDFSQAINSHRLWFISGADWTFELSRLFEQHPGLATPTQFIRMPDADPTVVDPLIAAAQPVFGDIGVRRKQQLQTLAREPIQRIIGRAKLCVVAPSRFRLWNDVGHEMLSALVSTEQMEIVPFDSDDPINSTPLALIQQARKCSAIFTANTARTDLPGILPENLPWLTWVTGARIPAATLAGANDRLIVADAALERAALAAGWRKEVVHVATWKTIELDSSRITPSIALIADTHILDTPADLTEYSSHSVLWESIRQELLSDPFALKDPGQFLIERMKRAKIAETSFPAGRFIEKLILPAYQQGLARIMIQGKQPLRLFGAGWQSLPEFAGHAHGEIRSRADLTSAVASSAALLHVWPGQIPHPIDTLSRPVLRPWTTNPSSLIKSIQNTVNNRVTSIPPTEIQPLTSEIVLRLLADAQY